MPLQEPDAIGHVLAQYRATTGHVTKEMITAAWAVYDRIRRPVLDRIREHGDVHRCEDCDLPTCYAIGSYWLASDALWGEIVGTSRVVLCPGCFHDRAKAQGIPVFWRAVRA